jgi:hypothetical protein
MGYGLAVALLVPLLQLAGSDQLVGRWDPERRSRGGLGTWIELAANGACTETIGALVDGKWRLEGDRLTLDLGIAAGASEVQTATVSIVGDTQVQVRGNESYRLARVDKAAGANPLVGVWTYAHSAGGQAYEEYTRDGRFLFRLPFTTTPCKWTATDDSLRITQTDQTHEFRWRLAGDVLTLQSGQKLSTLHREKAGILNRPKNP